MPMTPHAEKHFTGGAIKARFSGAPILRGSAQTTLIGGLAAAAAFAIASWIA